MKITQIVTTLVVLAVFILPVVAFASTYQYVDTNSRLQTVVANSSSEALATASNISPHSGVMLLGVGGTIGSSYVPYSGDGSYCLYVDSNGTLRTVDATSASAALSSASNISAHSGVMLVTK